jgi:hypothetical protein
MEQIVLHFAGDFLFQNNWMAVNKGRYNPIGWFACFAHCLIYSLPFLFFLSVPGVLSVLLAHFIIDKFGLAVYWTKFIKTGRNYSSTEPLFIFLVFTVDLSFHFVSNYLIFRFIG